MKNIITNSLLGVSTLAFVSCAGMYESMNQAAGLGVIREKQSEFDGSKLINMSPSMLANKKLTDSNYRLGATWSSKSPKYVALHISTEGQRYVGIRGIDVNINGKITSFKCGEVSNLDFRQSSLTNRYVSQSENSVLVSVAYLEKMINAQKCYLRIKTSRGAIDRDFTKEKNGPAPLAKFDLRKFLARVKTATK